MKFLLQQPRTVAWLLLLWVVATAFNLTKAVHIDDTAYLEMARAIRADPLHPMSGMVNWIDTREPIHNINQPPLFCYLLAGSMALFGESEIAFHLVLALFTLVAIVFFYLLALSHAPRQALILSGLFALGPAFIPSQNLMCDVPMLALCLVALWALVAPVRRPVLAATAAAVAALIKYTSLVLLPVLALDLLLRREGRRLWVLGIPLATLGGWSLFNYLDYGGIHLLGREATAWDPLALLTRSAAWLICLGAVAPFTVVLLPYLAVRRRGRAALALCLIAGLATLLWTVKSGQALLNVKSGQVMNVQAFLGSAFLTNGVLATGACFYYLARELARQGFLYLDEQKRRSWVLAAWFLGSGAFIILFAPFLAVRHVLPVLPVLLLVLGRYVVPAVGASWRGLALAATVLLGTAVAVSDWVQADVYRVEAGKLAQTWGARGRVWHAGHWGWQWYADQAGMMQYDAKENALREGDYLIVPDMVSCQRIAPAERKRLRKIDRITVPSGPATFLRTITLTPYGGYYYFGNWALPWNFVDEPLEEFTVFVVGPPIPAR